jgi:hypothetical protein
MINQRWGAAMAPGIFFVCNDQKKWLNEWLRWAFFLALWFSEEITIISEIDIRPFGKGLVKI